MGGSSVDYTACLSHQSAESPGVKSLYCLLTTGHLSHKCAPTCLQIENNLAQSLPYFLAAQSSD